MPERPFPGAELVARVAGTPDRDWFFESGERSVRETAALLAIAGRSFADFDRILDFGAGCGRMAIWLEDVAASGTELHATDIDAEAVAWMAEHLPFVTATANDPTPPLPYPDDHFGLVYNHSVLSHLDEGMQDRWLAELRRVTRPDGLVVLTVHGEPAFAEAKPDAAARARYEDEGILFVQQSQYEFPDWYGVAYHATWYVFAHWSEWFRVRAYVPGGALGLQDMVLLSCAKDEPNPYERVRREQPPAPAPQPSLVRRVARRLR